MDEVIEAFVAQHYLEMDVPPVVLANVEENGDTISELLNALSPRTVYFARKPQGIRKKWLDLATMNARISLGRKLSEESHQVGRIEALTEALGLLV